jgi:RNA-binding protein
MAALELTPKERQALKGQAHALAPVVLLGSQGLTEAVVKEIDRALTAHELIKVRVPGDDREERDAMFHGVADQLNAACVQSIGKMLVLYRPLPDEVRAERDAKAQASARAQAARSAPAAPRTKKLAAAAADRRGGRASKARPSPGRSGR